MTITLVAMIDMDNGIGDEDGRLLYNIPEDMKHFKETTYGKTIVMGRKTWESLPKKPLEGRCNIVLTRDEDYVAEGAIVSNCADELLKLGDDLFIIGGGEIYEKFLPHADEMILTHVHHVNPFATSFFPDYESKEWAFAEPIDFHDETPHTPSFAFAKYKRK